MLKQSQGVFKCLNSHDVKYVVIGGVAAVLHGVPRSTFDVDILIEATLDNAKRLLDSLLEAGMGTASLTTPELVLANEITIFKDFIRLDVQTRTPGLSFHDAWNRREMRTTDGGVQFPIVSRNDLIASKTAAGRNVDLEDVRVLKSS
jgi:predicted nucleotidyltransferase